MGSLKSHTKPKSVRIKIMSFNMLGNKKSRSLYKLENKYVNMPMMVLILFSPYDLVQRFSYYPK